jgi:uncharacterized protein YegL
MNNSNTDQSSLTGQPLFTDHTAPWFQPVPSQPFPTPPVFPPPFNPGWPHPPAPLPPNGPNPPVHIVPLGTAPKGAQDAALKEVVDAFVAAEKSRKPARRTKRAAKPRTHVFFVLDASSSMLAGKAMTLAGYNQQVDIVREQAKDAGATSVSLLVFSHEVQSLYAYQEVDKLEHLTDATYRPNGSTALLDALGAAIRAALAAPGIADESCAVLVALFTDGEENASRLYTGPALSECVKALQETGRFTFTLMGPKEHLNDLASLLSIARGNIAGFDASSLADRGRAMGTMAQATSTYMSLRSAGVASSANLYSPPPEEDPPTKP